MLIIDKFAYTNKLKNINPRLKIGLSLTFIALALINKNIYFFIGIICGGFYATVFLAGIPLKNYMKMMLIPFAFLLTSMIALLVSFSSDSDVFLYSIDLKFFYGGVTLIGLKNAFLLFLRSMSSLVSLYFLTLTTPMDQQIYTMQKLRIPSLFLEIYSLIYRFIFILLEESLEIYRAQELRFGYINMKNSYFSLSILIRTLFVRVMRRYKDMQIVLDMKLFDGEFHIGKGAGGQENA